MADTLTFFATTAKGMEELLADELTAMGVHVLAKTRAGVSFEGPLEAGYRACLWSRIANRVLLPLGRFAAPTPEKLYGGVKAIRWSDHLTPNETLAVDFTSSSSAITHTHFGALKTKDAIVDQLRSVLGERPSIDPLRPDIRVNVYVHENQATVSLDLSGDSLHRRGYREESQVAPLKENLAAAILMAAGWPKVAAAGGGLIDPMCGSGTLPIEAALMATDTAPGLFRKHFGFLGWQGHVPALWKRLHDEATRRRKLDKKLIPPIIGYDQDFRAVRVALSNLERSGMHGFVHIEKRELASCAPVETRATSPKGLIVVNPPYGERIGEVEELKPLYKELGNTFKQKFKGWEGYIFTGSPDLMKSVGLQASRRIVLFNGAIECRLLRYELFEGSREAKRDQGTF